MAFILKKVALSGILKWSLLDNRTDCFVKLMIPNEINMSIFLMRTITNNINFTSKNKIYNSYIFRSVISIRQIFNWSTYLP